MSLVFPSQGQGMAVVVGLVTDLNGCLNIKCHRLLTLEGEREERERGGYNSQYSLSPYKYAHMHVCAAYVYTSPTHDNTMTQLTQDQLINKHTLKNQIKRAINKA